MSYIHFVVYFLHPMGIIYALFLLERIETALCVWVCGCVGVCVGVEIRNQTITVRCKHEHFSFSYALWPFLFKMTGMRILEVFVTTLSRFFQCHGPFTKNIYEEVTMVTETES